MKTTRLRDGTERWTFGENIANAEEWPYLDVTRH